jgi:hypothetical protein
VAVEPDAGVDGEPLERPLILGEQTEDPVFLGLISTKMVTDVGTALRSV